MVTRPPCSSNLRGKPLFIYFRKNGKLYFRATDNLVKKYDHVQSHDLTVLLIWAILNGENFVVPRPPLFVKLKGKAFIYLF